MTDPTAAEAGTLTQVFTELFRNRRRAKLTPEQVAERLHVTDVSQVKAAMEKVFFADLLHMTLLRATPDATRYTWHYRVTARAGRIVTAVGLDGVTDEIIRSEYHDAMGWLPRKRWDNLAGAGQA